MIGNSVMKEARGISCPSPDFNTERLTRIENNPFNKSVLITDL